MGMTFSKPLNGKQPKSTEAKDLAAFYNQSDQPEVVDIPADAGPAKPLVAKEAKGEVKGAANNPPKPDTKAKVEVVGTVVLEPSSSSSTAITTSTSSLPDTKRVLSNVSSASYQTTPRATMTLDDYLKNTTLKPMPGLLFKDVLPFQPLTSTRLIHEEVDNLAQLAVRLRDLRRSLQYDFIQLTVSAVPLADAKDDKAAVPLTSARRLSYSAPAGEASDWALFRPEEVVEKERLAEALSRLSCDERLEVLAMLDELRQQLASTESASASSSTTTSETVTPSLTENAQRCYQAALLAHDRRQGWAKLVPPASSVDPKEMKETKGLTTATGENRVIPPAFVQLREDLGRWLGVNPRLSREDLRTRLLAIQDYCQTAQRISECSVHLQHEIQLARRVVGEFKSHAFKDDPELVQAICQLAAAQDPELLRALLGTLIDSIKESSLLQVHVLQGLATVLTHSRAEDVGLGDLHTILNLLQSRTQGIGSDLSDADTLQLLQTLGAVLASMAVISQQRQLARQQVLAAHDAAKALVPSAKEQLLSIPAVPLTTASGDETSVFERAKFLVKAKTDTVKALVSKSEDTLEKDSAAILSADAYDALCKGLHQAVVESIQTRYGEDLRSNQPELYFAVLLIRQALMRLAHKEPPAKLLQKAYQFFTILDKAKNAVSNFSIISLLQAGNQMADLIGSTAWGKKIGAHFAGEEARPQPWFEQFLILKTLIGSDQLRELETTLVQAGCESNALTLNYPLCLGTLQLLDSVVQSENRPEVRKAAIQLLQLLASDQPWQWPTTAEFVALQQRLKEKCDKDYASDGRLTLEQRRQQQNYQRAQQHSQVALRTARRHCQESDIRFQLHDYCLLQTRQAHQDAQWLQDNGRYIPALAKPRFDVTDDNAQLFFPMFDTFVHSGHSTAAETKDSKANSSFKAQSALLILGDAGTGKSLFIRRNHLIHCERYISRQFDQDSENATALGNTSHPLSFHLYLNQSPVEKPLEHYLQQQGFTEEHIRQLKDQGQLLVHLDGYDEWSTQGQNPWVFSPKTLGPWVSPRSQVIVACRSQHIQGAKDYKDYFTPSRKEVDALANARDTGALSEWIITCLDEGGVAQLTAYYVHDEQAQNRNPWSQQKYLQQFRDSNIQGLVRTPIILLMALQVLPTLQKRMPDNAQILRLDIYREFISQYLQTQRSKQLARGTQHLTGVIEAAESYAQALALALFNQEKAAVSYQPKARFSFAPQQDNPWHRFFSDGSPDQLLSTIIPLRVNAQRNVQDGSTITQYSFTHKSMLDYFTALGLYQAVEDLASQLEEAPPKAPTITLPATDKSAMPLLQAAHAIPQLSMSLSLAMQWETAQRYAKAKHEWEENYRKRLQATPWSSRPINAEQSVIQFIGEILKDQMRSWEIEQAEKRNKEREEAKGSIKKPTDSKTTSRGDDNEIAKQHPFDRFKAQLIKVIQASRHYPRELGQASSNAATVLCAIELHNLASLDLRGVQLAGADLSYSVFAHSNLSGANLQGATLIHPVLYGTNLRDANLLNVRWGEFPRLDLKNQPYAIAWHPAKPWLAVAQGNEIVQLHRETGEPVSAPCVGHTWIVTGIAYSPDGRYLVSASADKTVRRWNAETGEPIGTPLIGHTGKLTSVAYSPDGRHFASTSYDKTVRQWDAETGELIGLPLAGHTKTITSVAYSLDSHRLVTGGEDGTVRQWDAESGKPIGEPLTGHLSHVTAVAYSMDSRRIVSGSSDRTIRQWDAESGKPIGEPLTGHTSAVSSVVYSHDGRRIASGSYDKTIRQWDAERGIPIGAPLAGHTDRIIVVAYSYDNQCLVSGSLDNTIRQWDAGASNLLGAPFVGHTNWVSSLACSRDGRRLVSGSNDRTMQQWDVELGTPVGTPLTEHTGQITGVSYSPDGRQFASAGGYDRTIRLWDAKSGRPIGAPFLGHKQTLTGIAYSPDNRRLASGSEDNTICQWDTEIGKLIGVPFIGHKKTVTSVAYSPDGRHLASGSEDNTIRQWDAETGLLVGMPLTGHTDKVTSVTYSPNGRYLISASGDKTVHLWDAATGKLISAPFAGHSRGLTSVAFSPDGRRLVSAGHDKTVRLWDVESHRCLAVLQWNQSVYSIALVASRGTAEVTSRESKSVSSSYLMKPAAEDWLIIGDTAGTISFWAVSIEHPETGFRMIKMPKHHNMPLCADSAVFEGCQMSTISRYLLTQQGADVSKVSVIEEATESPKLEAKAGQPSVDVNQLKTLEGMASLPQPETKAPLTGTPSNAGLFAASIVASSATTSNRQSPADAKAQHLLTASQALLDTLYPADKSEMALQRIACLVKLQPYRDREASLTVADRAGLRLLRGELEDVQEALAVSTPAFS